MVCRLHFSSNSSLRRVFTPSPNRVPSGRTTAARPPVFRSRMMRARKRSAVSLVLNFFGKLVSIPSASTPPKGGLDKMTLTRSLEVHSLYGLAK